MLIRLRLSALLRYPHCLSVTVTPGLSRSLMTGAARASQLKKVNSAVSTSTENSKGSTSLAAKVWYYAKTGVFGLYSLVVIVAFTVALITLTIAAWTILKVWKL